MTSEERSAVDNVMHIVEVAGKIETVWVDGHRCSVKTYQDPFGGGLTLRYGGVDGSSRKQLTAQNGDGEYLLRALAVDGTVVSVLEFDTTTAWTLYLSACVADVREKYGR